MKFIGDVVLTTPVIRSVRASFPEAHIAYLGDKEAVSLLENNPFLNEIIPFDFTRPTILEQPRVMLLLRKRRFDAVVDFFGNPRSALLSYSSGARIRIGGDFGARGKLFTHRITDDGKAKSAIEFHYQYVRPLAVEAKSWKTEIFLTGEEIRESKIYLRWHDFDVGRPIVGLHPGASWPAKMWPVGQFAELAKLITEKLGAQVLITRGPGDTEAAEAVAQKAEGTAKLLGVLPLRQLAAILAQCSVYVANDSGPMHIAAAVNTPTIGIFGPGEEDIWFPYRSPFYENSAGHIALRKNVFCHPCHLNVCNRDADGYMECMRLLTAAEVLDEVRKRLVLKGGGSSRF